ncbi:hypothetical protein JCM8097_002510 [Rhodosporidiobolus ruineniae]
MSTSSTRPSWRDAVNPPHTPVRTTLPLHILPDAACPKRTSRKRAPPSPLDGDFASSSRRRDHPFTLSTACNQLPSPSTPTAPLLPPAPIFMPLPPTPSTLPKSSPMKRSPAMQALCRFTADAFEEERLSLAAGGSPNSLGLFDFYRESSSLSSSPFSSPELGGPPSSSYASSASSSSGDDDTGRWSDAPESDLEDDHSEVIFARRISFDSATPSPQSTARVNSAFRTVPLPDLAAFPVTPFPPLFAAVDEPSSPVPSLSYSTGSSPASSLASLSTSPSSSPSTPSPSPTSQCIATFASTSFFSSSSPLSSTSSLAQRRLESLEKRRKATTTGDSPFFGLGLSL